MTSNTESLSNALPYWLQRRGRLVGRAVSPRMRVALEAIANARHTPVHWYEPATSRTARRACGYGPGDGSSPSNPIPLTTIKALFERRLIAVDLGDISRSIALFITPIGLEVLGRCRADFILDWDQSDNLL